VSRRAGSLRTSTRRRRVVVCSVAFTLMVAGRQAASQPAPAPGDGHRTWLEVSTFRPAMSSSARADWVAAERPGTSVDLERDLGLRDNKTLPAVLLGTRLGERGWVEFEYLTLRRAASRRLEREIVWEDTVYPVSASLDSRFESDVARVSVGATLLSGPSHAIGAVLGLHVTRFEVELSGRVASGASSAAASTERQQVLVPLPTIGLQGRLTIAEGWDAAGRLDGFALSGDGWRGSLVNVSAGLHWRATSQFGLSLGWRLVEYRVEGERGDWRGEVRYRFSGPGAGIVLRF
jgi:hypothetical protein